MLFWTDDNPDMTNIFADTKFHANILIDDKDTTEILFQDGSAVIFISEK